MAMNTRFGVVLLTEPEDSKPLQSLLHVQVQDYEHSVVLLSIIMVRLKWIEKKNSTTRQKWKNPRG